MTKASDRVGLSNGSWFDRAKARRYSENQEFDGRNFISCVTGSQWDHECLYLTAGGTWILCQWSQWQGSRTSYEIISADDAARWFSGQGLTPPKVLREKAAALEV